LSGAGTLDLTEGRSISAEIFFDGSLTDNIAVFNLNKSGSKVFLKPVGVDATVVTTSSTVVFTNAFVPFEDPTAFKFLGFSIGHDGTLDNGGGMFCIMTY
jgi:hypothetical protein